MKTTARRKMFQAPLYILAIFGLGAGVYNALSALNFLTPAAHAQQDPFLERRISQIEQRFSFIGTRISRLEQNSRFPSALPGAGGASETEIRLLRSQLEMVGLRLGEAECALVKLDERTLSADARRSLQRRSTGEPDVCRLEAETPLRLSARP